MRVNETTKTVFETLVRERLAIIKHSPEWLADKLGIVTRTLQYWFKEPGKVKEIYRPRIAQLLGIPRTELFPEEAAEFPSE